MIATHACDVKSHARIVLLMAAVISYRQAATMHPVNALPWSEWQLGMRCLRARRKRNESHKMDCTTMATEDMRAAASIGIKNHSCAVCRCRCNEHIAIQHTDTDADAYAAQYPYSAHSSRCKHRCSCRTKTHMPHADVDAR